VMGTGARMRPIVHRDHIVILEGDGP